MKTLKRLTLASVMAAMPVAAMAEFAKLDGDSSGNLSFTEMEVVFPILTQERFSSIDTNNNGSVSEAELTVAQDEGDFPPFDL